MCHRLIEGCEAKFNYNHRHTFSPNLGSVKIIHLKVINAEGGGRAPTIPYICLAQNV
jgi:hypothetical protein